MKRPDHVASEPTPGGQPIGDEIWGKKYPHIVEYLTCAAYDDGGSREPSALSVRVEGADIQLALNDKDLKQSLYTQATTFTDAMRLMNEALGSGKGQWRPWKGGKKK